MANKVEIIVVAKDETKPAFDKVKAESKKAGAEAGKSLGDGISKGMADTKASIEKNGLAPISVLIAAQQRAAKAAEKLGEAQKKFGEDSKQAADASLTLARANIAVESSAKNAAAAVGKMSPELEKMLKDVGVAGKALDEVGNALEGGFKKLATSATKEGVNVGKNLGESVSKAATEEVGKLGGSLTPVLIGVFAGIAPLLGGVLAAGIIGAAGVGGIAGGIILAAKDPAIAAAYGDLGVQIGKSLNEAAEGFKKPLLEALPVFRQAWQGIDKDISAIFQKAQTWVAPLSDAVSSFATSIVGGLKDLVTNGDDVMAVLFQGIKDVGTAIGDMFTSLSEHGPEAALALQLSFQAVVLVIDALSDSISFLSEALGILSKLGVFGSVTGAEFQVLTATADESTTAVENVGRAFDGTKSSIEATRQEMQRMSDDLKAASDPMFALIKAQQLAKDTQDDYNKAVKEHGVNSEEARAASEKLAEAAVSLTGKSAEAAGSFDGKLTPAMRNSLEAAGATEAQIAAVERSVKAAHDALTKYEGNYTAHVLTVFETIGKPSALATASKDTYKGLRTGGTIGAAMSGGVQGNLTLVGEDGPELVSLPYGSSVKTAGMTNQLLEEAVDPHKQKPGSGSAETWSAVLAELRMLRGEVARTGRGNVYLDSRLVGSVQGSQADLYERAG